MESRDEGGKDGYWHYRLMAVMDSELVARVVALEHKQGRLRDIPLLEPHQVTPQNLDRLHLQAPFSEVGDRLCFRAHQHSACGDRACGDLCECKAHRKVCACPQYPGRGSGAGLGLWDGAEAAPVCRCGRWKLQNTTSLEYQGCQVFRETLRWEEWSSQGRGFHPGDYIVHAYYVKLTSQAPEGCSSDAFKHWRSSVAWHRPQDGTARMRVVFCQAMRKALRSAKRGRSERHMERVAQCPPAPSGLGWDHTSAPVQRGEESSPVSSKCRLRSPPHALSFSLVSQAPTPDSAPAAHPQVAMASAAAWPPGTPRTTSLSPPPGISAAGGHGDSVLLLAGSEPDTPDLILAASDARRETPRQQDSQQLPASAGSEGAPAHSDPNWPVTPRCIGSTQVTSKHALTRNRGNPGPVRRASRNASVVACKPVQGVTNPKLDGARTMHVDGPNRPKGGLSSRAFALLRAPSPSPSPGPAPARSVSSSLAEKLKECLRRAAWLQARKGTSNGRSRVSGVGMQLDQDNLKCTSTREESVESALSPGQPESLWHHGGRFQPNDDLGHKKELQRSSQAEGLSGIPSSLVPQDCDGAGDYPTSSLEQEAFGFPLAPSTAPSEDAVTSFVTDRERDREDGFIDGPQAEGTCEGADTSPVLHGEPDNCPIFMDCSERDAVEGNSSRSDDSLLALLSRLSDSGSLDCLFCAQAEGSVHGAFDVEPGLFATDELLEGQLSRSASRFQGSVLQPQELGGLSDSVEYDNSSAWQPEVHILSFGMPQGGCGSESPLSLTECLQGFCSDEGPELLGRRLHCMDL